MYRIRNVPARGGQFSQIEVLQVWQKGRVVTGFDPKLYRKDSCGAWIVFTDYGQTTSAFGWEIDHIHPRAHGGGDEIQNLQPLQWENNRQKADSVGPLSCKTTSSLTKNVYLS